MRVMTHRVRYHEADAQGYMFNSRYLEIADVAMTEYFRLLGMPYLEMLAAGADPTVVQASLGFRQPARFEDELDVYVTCPRVGRSSFDLHTRVLKSEDLVASMELIYVNVNAAQARSQELPAQVASLLRGDPPGPNSNALGTSPT
jgi:acyl-CoA thioester hydrolase